MGSPIKFTEALAAKIFDLAKQGKTNKQIAEIIGISDRTFQYWCSDKPEFLQSLKENKQIADELVEASLFRKAVGYSHEAVKIMAHEGHSWEHEYTEHYPPDSTAAIFWLKNRQPEKWRDKVDIEHSGSIAIKKFKLGHAQNAEQGSSDRDRITSTDTTTEKDK